MSEGWEVVAAEKIREQAGSGTAQDRKIVIGPAVFNAPVTINGDLSIISE